MTASEKLALTASEELVLTASELLALAPGRVLASLSLQGVAAVACDAVVYYIYPGIAQVTLRVTALFSKGKFPLCASQVDFAGHLSSSALRQRSHSGLDLLDSYRLDPL